MRLIVEVRPRAARNEIVALRDRVLHVRVTAPPAEGAANEAVRQLLARALDWAPSRIEIVRGQAARTKLVRIAGLTTDAVMARLAGRG